MNVRSRSSRLIACALLSALVSVVPVGREADAARAAETAIGLPPVFHAAEQPQITALAKRTFAQMQSGKLDRGLFSPSAKAALDDDQLAIAAQQLQALGQPSWTFVGEYHSPSGIPVPEVYLLTFPAVALRLEIALDRAGKITNFFLSPSTDEAAAN